jgi:hypothetical protein
VQVLLEDPRARRTSARAGAFRPDACLGQVVEE